MSYYNSNRPLPEPRNIHELLADVDMARHESQKRRIVIEFAERHGERLQAEMDAAESMAMDEGSRI